MMRPPPWARSTGSAALVTFTTPSRLASICSRKSSGVMSSIAARLAYPALLTTTSIRPNAATPAATAACAAATSVTSSATGRIRSP